ncbi:protein ARV1-like [Lytechinus pictus]|uniref:protein ARV1-like n=1 Tax=Lytechinus pictus TaxID=7653 RepID=UPI0030B9FD45
MAKEVKQSADFRCIECGFYSRELYHDYGNGIIKISHCEKCKQVVDKYVEFDPVIVLIDALLFKPQAYRHVLFNKDITFHWRLCIVCLLCDAYMKWAHKSDAPSEEESKPFLHYALQWDFYAMFTIAGLELLAFIAGVVGICVLHAAFSDTWEHWKGRSSLLVKALLLSSTGKLLVIPVVIWGETHIYTTLLLTRLFMTVASTQAITVILDCPHITSISLVGFGFITEALVRLLTPSIENILRVS